MYLTVVEGATTPSTIQSLFVYHGDILIVGGYAGISNSEEIVISVFLFSQLLSAISCQRTTFSHSPSFLFDLTELIYATVYLEVS